jgi:hypothetical protein
MNSEQKKMLEKIENLLKKPLNFLIPRHEDGGIIKPYEWNQSRDGDFRIFNLIKSEGWIHSVEPEAAIFNWQLSEKNGLAANTSGGVQERDYQNIRLTQEEIEIRTEKYHVLLEYLKSNLQDIQACTINADSAYCWSGIIGKLPDSSWICLGYTAPVETWSPSSWEMDTATTTIPEPEFDDNRSDVVLHIEALIEEIKPIYTYGYYDNADYNNTHSYRLISVNADSKEDAIELALLKTRLVEVRLFNGFFPKDQLEAYDIEDMEEIEQKFRDLNLILKESCITPFLYRFSFWYLEYLYFVDSEKTGDKVGVMMCSYYTYNP